MGRLFVKAGSIWLMIITNSQTKCHHNFEKSPPGFEFQGDLDFNGRIAKRLRILEAIFTALIESPNQEGVTLIFVVR